MQSPSTSPRCVHKFGGASLADGERIRRVGELLLERSPDRPIAVVSAVEGVTAQLDLLARDAASGVIDMTRMRVRHRSLLAQLELDSEHLNRHFTELATLLTAIRAAGELTQAHRDHVLSFGERASARILAAHLSQRGLRAVPIDAYDLGLVSDSNHGRARVLPQSAERVRSALERIDAICVITGFVAADAQGRLTTLGRNGSDVSAALIGEAIGAREVVFWKEVDGVMSADPKLVPQARTIEQISYASARELTAHGASVLHPEAVEVLERSGVPGRVRCTRTPRDEGTRVERDAHEPDFLGVATRSHLALVSLDASDAALEQLAAAAGRWGVEAVWIGVDNGRAKLLAPLGPALERLAFELGASAQVQRNVASLTVFHRAEVAEELENALAAARVGVLARWRTGRNSRSCVAFDANHLAFACACVHARLMHLSANERATPRSA